MFAPKVTVDARPKNPQQNWLTKIQINTRMLAPPQKISDLTPS